MSSALSKRQQARNEKALQDLVQSVPGNNICADCHARNPGMTNAVINLLVTERAEANNLHNSLGVMECTSSPLPQ
jgi:hypothetical protein